MPPRSEPGLASRLEAAKKSGRLAPLWVIADDEPLLALEAANDIRAAARSLGCAEREVLTLSPSSDWTAIETAVGGMSLFAELKIVEIRLTGPSPGTKGGPALSRLGSREIEGACVIVSIPEADWQVKKLKWFKDLTARAEVVSCDPVPPAAFQGWLSARLKTSGLEAEPDAVTILAEQTEGNLLAAAQEVRKLAILHKGTGPLTADEVRSSVMRSSRFELDAVSLAAMAGDAARACRAIDSISAELDPSSALPYLMSLLTNDIRKMIAARDLMDEGRSDYDISRALRLFPPEKSRAVLGGARRLTARKLRNALSVCADIDRIYKGLSVPSRDTDPWTELKSVAVFLAR